MFFIFLSKREENGISKHSLRLELSLSLSLSHTLYLSRFYSSNLSLSLPLSLYLDNITYTHTHFIQPEVNHFLGKPFFFSHLGYIWERKEKSIITMGSDLTGASNMLPLTRDNFSYQSLPPRTIQPSKCTCLTNRICLCWRCGLLCRFCRTGTCCSGRTGN